MVVAFSFVCTLTGADQLVTMAIASLAFSVLIWPVLVFVHELGHAETAVAFTGQRVVIRMGGDPYLVRFASAGSTCAITRVATSRTAP